MNHTKGLVPLLVLSFLGGCANNQRDVNQFSPIDNLPTNWQTPVLVKDAGSLQPLIESFQNPKLEALIKLALNNNFELDVQRQQLEILRLTAVNAGATFWPSLDANLSARRADNENGAGTNNTFSAGLNLRYEIDIWQKLSASKQQASLQYMAELANFDQQRRLLVKNVVLAWLDVIEANQVTELLSKRVNNSKQNLDIIENGYRKGLNEALDVYLARNEFNSERSRLALQMAQTKAAVRSLERLVGQYPAAELKVAAELPKISLLANISVPSEVVKLNPAVQSKWYQLLASDAGLAFSQKSRFPSLVLSASVNDSTSTLQDLFSGNLAWSILANATAPIFDAGRLKNNVAIAEHRVKQAEQSYLAQVFSTLQDIENSLTTMASLEIRYKATLAAEQNAVAAEKLAFEKYKSGLVNYTTVLDSQSRAFDAKSLRIQLSKQIVLNQLNLQFATGDRLTQLLSSSGNSKGNQ